MAKGTRGRRRVASRQYRPTPYDRNVSKLNQKKRSTKVFEEKKDWEDANCSVCMEYPHNAVLLLCSSHDKGCRPYMCGTSCRYSNCLDQYKKAYTKVTSPHRSHPWLGSVEPVSLWHPIEKHEVTELACPLCRGQVKGWTVVEPAREHLNAKKRTCMHDNCSFVGTYKELRKHVRAKHPSAKPRDVDPVEEQKWSRLEREREREDVISTIRSSMPGAVVFGDYVIEGSHYSLDSDDEDERERDPPFEIGIENNFDMFFLLNALGPTANGGTYRGMRWHERDSNRSLDRGGAIGGFDSSDDSDDESGGGGYYDGISLTSHLRRQGGGDGDGMSLAGRLHRQGRVLLGRSGRRQRRREASGGRR